MRKNAIFMAIYEIAIYLVPFITTPYIARVLGTYGTGVYSYTYSIASYFVILIQLGVSLYGRREIASCLNKEERSKTFWSIWFIETAMFLISSVLYVGFILFYNTDMKIALAIQYILLLGAWLDISWLFFGVENFIVAVSRNVVVKLLSLIAVFVFVKKETDVNIYVFIMAFSSLLGVIVMWVSCRRYLSFCRIGKAEIRKHIRPLFKLFIPVLSVQLYALTDKVFLGALATVDDVGVYDNAYRISRMPVALITTLGTVMLPRVTKMIAEGKESEIRTYFNKSLSLTVFIGVGCAFGLIGLAPTLVPLYLGNNFLDAIPLLQILSIILIAIAWGNTFRNQFILPKKMDNLYLKSVVLAALLNIVMNILLIPLFGAVGAAIASVLAEFIICFYQSIKIKEYFDYRKLLIVNSKYLFSGILMLFVVVLLSKFLAGLGIVGLLIEITAGAGIYLAVSCLLEAVVKQKVVFAELQKVYYRIRRIKG